MDLSKLRDVCRSGDGIDEALLVQLLGMFLDDNRERVLALRRAVDARDLEQTRRLAHTLAGSVGTAGALTLSGMARAIESLAHDGRLPEAEAVAAVEAEFARVETVVRTSYPLV
jgi:HPt (histidine-containing phosphotransfer) domain-containing protein